MDSNATLNPKPEIFSVPNLRTICTRVIVMLALLMPGRIQAQVSSYYIFSQSNGTYTPLVADFPSTPANIYTTSWDDIAYTFPIPFTFNFNGTSYPAGTAYIGLDTDAWFIFSNGVPTMTGQLGGGSWVSISNHNGVYLYGTANNNGFAGFNCDLNNQDLPTFTANRSNGSRILTNVSSVANVRIGTRLSGTGIPDGTVVTNITTGPNTIEMSANATSNGTNFTVTPRASIFYKVIGTAPNRSMVVQWTQAKRYGGTGTDNFNFQMRINEGGGNPSLQTLQVIYGPNSATSTENLDIQVGLRGASTADFNARSSSTNWSATTAATANTDFVRLNNTLAPASGLTFTWSPCTSSAGAAGAITGNGTVCPNTNQTYSISPVANASGYIWSYSGSGVTYNDTTPTPSNTFAFSQLATSGTLTVTAYNLCGNGTSSTRNITVTAITPASISYPQPSYCISTAGNIAVTRTGPSGGTYTTVPATGLTINASTGAITPSTSTAGTYTVVYTYTSSGCTGITNTTVAIAPLPVVSTSASPAIVCTGSNVQLNATVANNSDYTVSSIPHSMLTPSGSPTTIWNTYQDGAVSGAIALPFAFNYFGQPVTQFYVHNDGYIVLQTAQANSLIPQTLPNATSPNNVIALAWDDLELDPSINPGAYVRYFVNGTTPNRIMVVEYNKLNFWWPGAGEVTGQIRLYESDGHIEVAAATVNDAGDNSQKTLGIENSTGTVGTAPAGRNNAVWNVNNESWAFYPPVGSFTYSWSPATYLSATNIANPVATGVAGNITYTVTVTNTSTGCQSTANQAVTVQGLMSGTYTVGTAGDYPTLTAAVNAYNQGCIGGPIVFSLINTTYNIGSGETFPITINALPAQSSVNTLTIRPAAAVTATITGSVNSNALIRVLGNYITIDGSNNGTNTRNLTISNTSSTSPSVVLMGSTGTTPIVSSRILNSILINGVSTSTGLVVSDAGTIGNAGYSNNITIKNNEFQRAFMGVYVRMVSATGNGSGLLIDSNNVAVSGAMGLRYVGIYVEGVDNGTISNNDVGNFQTTSAEVKRGIWIAVGNRNLLIEKNKIHDVRYTGSSGYAGQGIALSTGVANNGIVIRNNMMYTFTGDGDSFVTYGGAYSPTGIYLFGSTPAAQTGVEIYNNTIYMTGNTLNRSNALSAGIIIDDNNTARLRNNMIHNRLGRSASTGIGTFAVVLENAASQLLANSNYNNYFCNATGSGVNQIGRIGGTNYATLANWQTATSREANSRNIQPVFVSASDLHMVPASNITLSDAGTPISGFTFDYDNQTRNGLTPDIGCDEWLEPNKGSWVGLVSIDWLNPVNWEANYVPNNTTDVFITGGYTFMPTVVTTQAVRGLSLSAPGAPSNIPILTLNNGTLQIHGTITRTGGSIDGANGTVEMMGTSAQTIPASLFSNNNLRNLIISNSHAASGVTLGGALDIYGSVTFGAAGLRLATGGHLTFKSTNSATAWLGNVTGKTIVGNATVERFIPTGISHGKTWQFVSVPLSGTQTINQAWQDTATSANQNRYSGYGTQLVSNISPLPSLFDASGGAPSVKTYNPATNTWVGVPNTTTTPIQNQRGYMVYVRGDRSVTTLSGAAVPTTLRAKGKLYTTGADLPPSTTVPANSFESIGNPYASAIDFLNITKPGPSQVDDAFYVWDPLLYGSYGFGSYQTISSINGYKPVPGGTAIYDATVTNTRIESGQAFLVHATGPGSGGTISFSEGAKLSGSNMVFRNPIMPQRNRTFLYAELYNSANLLTDGCLVAFDQSFSNAYNHQDALKILNPGENIGILLGGKIMSVEAHAPAELHDTIHLSVQNLRRQSYYWKFRPEQWVRTGLDAYLADRFLQTEMRISLSSATEIPFTVTTDASSSASNRFYIIFRPTVKQPSPMADISDIRSRDEGDGLQVPAILVQPNPVSDHVLRVKLRSFPGGQYQVRLTTPGGQIVYNGSVRVDEKAGQFTVSLDPSIPAGSYLLSVQSGEGILLTEKLLLQ